MQEVNSNPGEKLPKPSGVGTETEVQNPIFGESPCDDLRDRSSKYSGQWWSTLSRKHSAPSPTTYHSLFTKGFPLLSLCLPVGSNTNRNSPLKFSCSLESLVGDQLDINHFSYQSGAAGMKTQLTGLYWEGASVILQESWIQFVKLLNIHLRNIYIYIWILNSPTFLFQTAFYIKT